MSHAKMYLAGAVIAAASLVATGPAFATPTPIATTILFHDTAAGLTFVRSTNDGSPPIIIPNLPEISDVSNGFSITVPGTFSIPEITISILDPGTTLVSDQLVFSASGDLTTSSFMSNDGPPLPLTVFNPIFETGFAQTLLTAQDEQGDTLTVQFLSERDTPVVTSTSVPEPSTLALFGAALAALGMMSRRRSASSRA